MVLLLGCGRSGLWIQTGASRGFGRGIVTALSGAGARVVGIARDKSRLDEVRNALGDSFTAVPGDAADPYTARRLIEEHHPHTVVLCAGASPLTKPLQH